MRHFQQFVNATAPGTVDESIPLTPDQVAEADIVNGSSFAGFATTSYVKPSELASTRIFYRRASLSLTLVPGKYGDSINGESLVVVDLLSGMALKTSRTASGAGNLTLSVELRPEADGEMWEGGFNGGGVYGIGMLGADGSLVRTTVASSSISSSVGGRTTSSKAVSTSGSSRPRRPRGMSLVPQLP